MDDFNVSALHESKNEWGARLVIILTPLIIDGYKSILNESIKLCKDNHEMDKYLMTFQNLISRIPKWNAQIIENERTRICEKSKCPHLEDLVTCVHIIQLKILSAMRVGQKQKKINISIPKLDDFIHKTYINVARKVYKNVYLFEINVPPLQMQKNHRELEIIIQECILNTLRESIPVEALLTAYMDETHEEDVIEEIKEVVTKEPIMAPIVANNNIPASIVTNNIASTAAATTSASATAANNIRFNDIDYIKTMEGDTLQINAPKDIDRLEEISAQRYEERKREAAEEDDDANDRLTISDQPFTLNAFELNTMDSTDLLGDIEEL